MSDQISDLMKSSIIIGEASESEPEDESPVKKNVIKKWTEDQTLTKSTQVICGAVINGEASESEDETVSSAMSASKIVPQPQKEIKTQRSQAVANQHTSLFHKKLRHTNIALRTDLDNFVTSTTQIACKELSATEQQLLQSQLTLQSAITALKTLHQNSMQLEQKLNTVITSKFLPNVSIPSQKL